MNEIIQMPLDDVLALPAYPTAAIFPMLLDDPDPPAGHEGLTMPQFADQILKEGIREPLIIWNGFLLDGRNRREAAKKASHVKPADLAALDFKPVDLSTIPVRHADFETEEEADSWVLSLNIDRRTLNKDQLACIAVRYWEIESERAKIRQSTLNNIGTAPGNFAGSDIGDTKTILSRRFHVSEGYIQKARNLWTSDRPKFEKAAAGKERVIGKLVSPGQKIKPDTDPNELALQQINDAFNKIKAAMDVLAKSNSDTYASAKKNVQTKIERLSQQFVETFTHE